MGGTVSIAQLPAGTTLIVDDRAVETSTATDPFEIELVPGHRKIEVDGGSLGSFSTEIDLADLDRREISVELRPSVYFLGVVGNDDVGRSTVVDSMEPVLTSGRWHRLALPQQDAAALTAAGLQIDALRTQARGEGPQGGHWRFDAAQQQLDSETPASLYVFAILSDDLVATHVEIWLFPGGPGPAFADHVRVALDDRASISDRVDTELMGAGSTFERPWLGADFIDSTGAAGPVVLAVSPEGPAAAAGLSPGDVVAAINGVAVATSAELQRSLGTLSAGSRIEVGLANGNVTVPLGSSARIVDPDSVGSPFVSVLIAVRQLRNAGDGSVPD